MMAYTGPFLVLNGALALVAVGFATVASAVEKSKPPAIKVLGALDCDMVETTPVVFNDRLYRFESVRQIYPGNKSGTPYFRFVDVDAGKPTPAFAKGFHLGSAFVEGDNAYAFGVDKWGGSKITVFTSKDLEKWENRVALEAPG